MGTIVWGLLGAVSGVVSGILPDFSFGLPEEISGLHIHSRGVTLFTPLAFAAALLIGLAPRGLDFARVLLVLAATVVGWILAVNVWLHLGGLFDAKGGAPSPTLVFAIVGGTAGLVGAAVTFAGVARACAALRRTGAAALVLLAGALAGALFQKWIVIESPVSGSLVTSLGAGLEMSQFILLYVIWQAAVAAAIGFALSRRL